MFDRPENLLPCDGEAYLYEGHFTPALSSLYYQTLLAEIQWEQTPIVIFGKKVMQPRLTAWYGEPDCSYRYSGITLNALPWTETLLEIKKSIELESGIEYNSALLNLYRDGNDSMGWHRDNEKELGPNPIIGSVSFGEARVFRFQHVFEKELKISVLLNHGSFLLMKENTQLLWKHSISKSSKVLSPRINITFRRIV